MRRITSVVVRFDRIAGIDCISMFRQELPERSLRREQRRGEIAALEIAPGVQNVLGIDVDRVRVVAATAYPTARYLRCASTVSAMQDFVRNVICNVELQPCRHRLQRTIEIDLVRRIEERAHHRIERSVRITAVLERTLVEPLDL